MMITKRMLLDIVMELELRVSELEDLVNKK